MKSKNYISLISIELWKNRFAQHQYYHS